MFKRKDWIQDHGADGGDSSSSEDSESGEDVSSSGSEQAGVPHVGGERAADKESDGASSGEDGRSGSEDDVDSGGDAQQALPLMRLEDLSEDDYEDPADDPELVALKTNWLEAPKEKQLPGRALRCRSCLGVLILGAASLRSHVASRRHRRTTAALPDDAPDPVCFAEDVAADTDAEGETHAERLQRLDAEVAALRGAAAKAEAGGAKRKRVEGGEEQKKKDRPRPGKRQRQALREQWAADPASAPKQARKRARAQAAGDQAMAQPPAGGAGAAAEPRSMKRAVSERASMQPASDGPCAAAEPKSAKRAAIELGRARVAGAGAAGTGGRQKAPECGDIAAGKRARGVGQHLTVPEASEGGLQQRRKMKKAADRLDLVPTAAPASTQHAPTKVCKAARRAAQQPAVA